MTNTAQGSKILKLSKEERLAALREAGKRYAANVKAKKARKRQERGPSKQSQLPAELLARKRAVERAWYIQKKYDISAEEYDALLQKQNGHCAICSADIMGKTAKLDHSHVTGKIRGFLCHHCNVGLGHFQDSPAMLLAAAKYLAERS